MGISGFGMGLTQPLGPAAKHRASPRTLTATATKRSPSTSSSCCTGLNSGSSCGARLMGESGLGSGPMSCARQEAEAERWALQALLRSPPTRGKTSAGPVLQTPRLQHERGGRGAVTYPRRRSPGPDAWRMSYEPKRAQFQSVQRPRLWSHSPH